MDTERLCEQCAASNTGDALFCWQCFAPFPTAGSVIAADAGSGGLPSDPSYLGPQPASGGRLRNHGLLVIIVGAVLIAVSLGGVFVWNVWRGGSLRLPESIAGYSRVHDKAYMRIGSPGAPAPRGSRRPARRTMGQRKSLPWSSSPVDLPASLRTPCSSSSRPRLRPTNSHGRYLPRERAVRQGGRIDDDLRSRHGRGLGFALCVDRPAIHGVDPGVEHRGCTKIELSSATLDAPSPGSPAGTPAAHLPSSRMVTGPSLTSSTSMCS